MSATAPKPGMSGVFTMLTAIIAIVTFVATIIGGGAVAFSTLVAQGTRQEANYKGLTETLEKMSTQLSSLPLLERRMTDMEARAATGTKRNDAQDQALFDLQKNAALMQDAVRRHEQQLSDINQTINGRLPGSRR